MVKCIKIDGKRYPIYHSSKAYYFFVKEDGSLAMANKLAVDKGLNVVIYDVKKPFLELGYMQEKAKKESNAERKQRFYPIDICSSWV